MQRTRRPKKWHDSFRGWPSWMLVVLFAIGVLIAIVDMALFAGLALQASGLPLPWGLGSKPAPISEPAIRLSPAETQPGTLITVIGRGWMANDPVVVQLEAQGCNPEIVATPNAEGDGQFVDAFVLPASGCWGSASRVQVTGRSLETGKRAAAELRVLAALQTPTPTLVAEPTATSTPIVEPTPTATTVIEPTPTFTPMVDPTPTATRVVWPTATPTPTRVVWPTATPVAAIVDWRGEYFGNMGLIGTAKVVRNDRELAFDWQEGSPAAGIPNDGFSVRWTRTLGFDAGTYRFHVLMDDGVRLWLDNRLVMDAWSDHDANTLTTDQELAKGTHTVRVEYYERSGKARVHVWWEKVSNAAYPDWKGEYWPNRSWNWDAALVRNDREIKFDWGSGSPSPSIPADDFAVRWTRQWRFDAATYRFHAIVDDGVRLWVDGQLLIDAWQDGKPRELTADRAMVQGNRSVKVEYYEHTGGAKIHVWWEKVSPSYPEWKGEYWSNRDLSGKPALVRNDRNVDYDWGKGSPASGLPSDSFSVRWSRVMNLPPGLYRLYAQADDGIRVYVEDTMLVNEWHESPGDVVYSTDVVLAGPRRFVVEYYERGGDARVRFWWKMLGGVPKP